MGVPVAFVNSIVNDNWECYCLANLKSRRFIIFICRLQIRMIIASGFHPENLERRESKRTFKNQLANDFKFLEG